MFRSIRSLSSASSRPLRVRFAPSPTGEMHLGGLRTALYNYMIARKNRGKFILRIEDTDQQRVVEGSQDRLIENLRWAKLIPDEGPGKLGGSKGPYVQSERLDYYKEFVDKLLKIGAAYPCFCTSNRLELMRKDALRRKAPPKYDNKCSHLTDEARNKLMAKDTPHTIRFKLREGPHTFKDVVFGDVTLDLSKNEGDFIIMKSDGYPTYHLANIVDDHLMEISHVLRGVEWQISTPKHIQMFEALGLEAPQYCHLPLMLNSDQTKLSKRNEDLMLDTLKLKYLPDAIINFLVLSGGGFKQHTGEYYELEELVERFGIDRVSTHSCKLDMKRLDDMNQCAIGRHAGELVNKAYEVVKAKHPDVDPDYVEKAFLANKGRVRLLDDLIGVDFSFLWARPIRRTLFTGDEAEKVSSFVDKLSSTACTKEDVQELLNGTHKESFSHLSYKDFMHRLRILISGVEKGPGVSEMIEVLGTKEAVERIRAGV